MDSILLTDDDLGEDIIDDEYIDNNVPNFVTSSAVEDSPDDILKTEVLVCEFCLRPNVISTVPFNRRQKEVKQLRLDSVVYASLCNMSKLNKLDINSLLALLLKIVEEPEVSKKMAGSFVGIPKRKGKIYRSKKILSSSN